MPRVLAQVALILVFITCAGHPAMAMGWWPPKPKTELTEVTAFGSNPGNLKMFMYAPANVADNAPLVVVLHGCTQNADEYAERTQWNRLAERFGFFVVYPEQQMINNVLFCFNWFFPADASRDKGEALSIKQMIDRMNTDHSIDAERVYVTGLSALMPDEDDLFRGHTHRIYHEASGRPVVETYHIKGMLHAVSVDPGSGEDQGGTVGAYAEDRDVYSAFYAAKFWGLIKP